MSFLYSFAHWSVPVLAIIFVHECGHYYAARRSGVSKANVKIRMCFFPQHVVLKNSDGAWISPWQQPLYGQLCCQYFRGNRFEIIRYVGAGLVVQSLFVFLGTWLLYTMRLQFWAFSLFILSVQITAIYFLIEGFLYFFRKKPFGDFSGLWLLSKPAFCVVCLSVVILHTMAFLVFYLGH